jgi:hypothetical protein
VASQANAARNTASYPAACVEVHGHSRTLSGKNLKDLTFLAKNSPAAKNASGQHNAAAPQPQTGREHERIHPD